MYLKSLELHGFKSFPNRTVLTFERGTTVIVGPNGSGKSNISDAMRWVLGELSSRNIRGTKMEDVIFGGTDERHPMGFAEVSVTFDNTDMNHRVDSPYDEIKVTRRYYRSGDSEYLINGQQRRLRDITELFMNTGIGREGYSIVGQGRVAELLSKKSEDRRNVFEEAAGIAKFRHRKEETERKRASTRDNMERIIDIFDELEKRLGPLTKEAEKARRGLAIYEEKKRADVSLWLYDTQKIRTDLEKARDTYQLSVRELESIEESLNSLRAQDQKLFDEMDTNRLASEQYLLKMNACRERIHTLENEISVMDTEVRHKTELIAACERRISEVEAAKAQLSGERGSESAKISSLKEELKKLMDERLGILADIQKLSASVARLEKELSDSLVTLNKSENAAMDLKVNVDILKRSFADGDERGKSIRDAIAEGEAKDTELLAEVDRCEKAASGFTERISELEKTSADCDTDIEKRRAEREDLAERSSALRADKAALEEAAAALRKMEEHFEGYGRAVRTVMEAYQGGKLRGGGVIYGPLSQLISVRSEHTTAIEATLGADLQHIVVEDEETAKAAIAYLRDTQSGRTTFYPLTTIKPGNEPEEIRACASLAGYVDRADRLVACEEAFDDIIVWLLSRTVVFDTIDNAIAAARKIRYRAKLVTLDGQIINAGGSFTGGSSRAGGGSGMLSRGADIEAKMAEAADLADKILDLTGEMKKKEKAIHDLEQGKRDAEQQIELLRTMARAQLSALDGAKLRLQANREQTESLREEYAVLAGKGKQYESELLSLTKSLEQQNAKTAALRAEREERDGERNRLLDERTATQEELNGLAIRITELQKEIEMNELLREGVDSRLSDLEHEREGQKNLMAEYRTAIEEVTKKQKESRASAQAEEESLQELNQKREETESNASSYNARLGEIREQVRIRQEQKDKCVNSNFHAENRLRRLEEDQERLGSKLWDEYEISYEDAVALDYPPVTAENRAEIGALQASCRNSMRALEPVNLGAIEEYTEVKTRYDEMEAQVNDLRVSYKAAPPGKIIKSLSLLSGGEQAFVAIALFFAILQVNPTPFCIFDEIEAALDAVNVFRFGEYVKKMSSDTQFILITHRPGTMEIAEQLYGVTMQERGVSRVLPMNPEQMEQMKEELKKDGVL